MSRPRSERVAPFAVAFAGVVEDDVQDDVDALAVQRLHRGAQFREAARCKPRIGRKEGHRIVAPAIGETEGRQVALVDPGGDRHEFDGGDAELAEMRQARRLGERGDGTAQLLRDGRIELRERLYGDLVDEIARAERGPSVRNGGRELGHHGLRHEIGRVLADLAQARVIGIGTVEGEGVGVDKQLRRVEALSAGDIVAPMRAQAVACAGADAGNDMPWRPSSPRSSRWRLVSWRPASS